MLYRNAILNDSVDEYESAVRKSDVNKYFCDECFVVDTTTLPPCPLTPQPPRWDYRDVKPRCLVSLVPETATSSPHIQS